MVYVNSQQPVQNKVSIDLLYPELKTYVNQKFYMTVILVETKTVDQLVENLKKGKYKSEEDIRAKSKLYQYIISLANWFLVIQDTAIDDEIIAGSQKMTLKCPVCFRW